MLSRAIRLILAAGVVCGSSMAVAHSFKLDVISGADTNPNRVSEALEVDKGGFTEGRFEFAHSPEAERSGYYYHLGASRTVYKTDEVNTDEGNLEELYGSTALGYEWRPLINHGRAEFTWEINAGIADSVFVDRATGDVKFFQGENIGNRFDATTAGVSTTGKVPLSADAFFVFGLNHFQKTFEDYSFIEPEPPANLDYRQDDMEIGFEKEIWKKTYFENSIVLAKRRHDERPGRDDDGAIIEGSTLEYNLIGAKNSLEYRFNKRWKWRWGLDVSQREDKDSTYYDMETGEFYTHLNYRNGDYVNFTFEARYFKRNYDELIDTDDDEPNEFKLHDGYRVDLEYIHRIIRKKYINLDLVMGAQYEAFNNDNPDYQYQRFHTYGGIRWQPY